MSPAVGVSAEYSAESAERSADAELGTINNNSRQCEFDASTAGSAESAVGSSS